MAHTETETITIQQFCEKNHVSIYCRKIHRNPNMQNDDWASTASHYQIRLTAYINSEAPSREMFTYFSQGSAHTKLPKASEVLDCLASDAAGVENARNFEDWADEYGFDTDSRKAEKTYKACVKSADELKEFLGDEAYDTLLWHTERM